MNTALNDPRVTARPAVLSSAHPYPLVDENDVDAKDVYPTAEAAVAAVLAGLDSRG